MTRFQIVPACVLAAVLFPADHPQAQPTIRPELAGVLDFEGEHSGTVPRGWGGFPPGTFAVDGQVVHGGKWSVRIERKDDSPNQFTSVTKMIPIDFAGEQLELSGYLRTENVSDFAGLWMREDGDGGSVAFDNMQRRQLKGTNDWAEYSIVLPLEKSAKRLTFGILAAGTGKVWADDLRLLVDGKSILQVPRVEQPKTVLDLDRQFDALRDPEEPRRIRFALLGRSGASEHHPRLRWRRQWI